MSATGYIQVRTYVSNAQFPLPNVAVSVTATDGTAIAMRLTDRNGRIPPIPIPVPDKSESLSPDPGEIPFAKVNLYAHIPGYERVETTDVQIFADTTTIWNLEMIPLSELPNTWDQGVVYGTPPQNL